MQVILVQLTFRWLATTSLLIVSGYAEEQVLFSENFNGSKHWGASKVEDPAGQIGGTDQFVYAATANNQTAYTEFPLDGKALIPSRSGRFPLSYTLDTSRWTSGTNDWNVNHCLAIKTETGSSGPFEKHGSLDKQGFTRHNEPGEIRVPQTSTIRWRAGDVKHTPPRTGVRRFQIASIIAVTLTAPSEWSVVLDLTLAGGEFKAQSGQRSTQKSSTGPLLCGNHSSTVCTASPESSSAFPSPETHSIPANRSPSITSA